MTQLNNTTNKSPNIALLCISIVFMAIGYWAYSGQYELGFFVIALYVVHCGLTHLILKPVSKLVYYIGTFFFLIYGLLVLFSHIELIKDPSVDYFVHNDAADAFYPSVMDLIFPCKWSELIDKTFFSVYFSNYPLAAFLFGVWGKIGMFLDIEDLRLFFRIQIFYIGTIIVTLISDILCKKQIDSQRVIRNVIPFGLCTYLFITSGIFTRDIHVCLIYTIAIYITLMEYVSFRFIKYVIIILAAFGLRPVNGALACIFPVAFYYDRMSRKVGGLAYVILGSVFIILLNYASTYVSDSLETLQFYAEYNGNLSIGGLYSMFYTLPEPFKTMSMMVYELLMPLPWTLFIRSEGGTWLTLPFILSPYIMMLIFYPSLWYIVKGKKRSNNNYVFLLASIFCFAMIVFAAPHIRRAFAAIPSVFVCYMLISQDIPDRVYLTVRRKIWPLVFAISSLLSLYVILR